MLVKPRSAFVGKPSVVASSSGRAKYARYARLLPSTRKRSDSRAGPSSSWSSAPVSVFGIARTTVSSGDDGDPAVHRRRRRDGRRAARAQARAPARRGAAAAARRRFPSEIEREWSREDASGAISEGGYLIRPGARRRLVPARVRPPVRL